MNTDLINRYVELDLQIQNLKQEAKVYCNNKDIPLKDRWKVFSECDCGESYSSVIHWTDYDKENNTDFETQFNSTRGTVIDLVFWIDSLESDLSSGCLYTWITQEVLDSFREYLMEIWLKEYTYDW